MENNIDPKKTYEVTSETLAYAFDVSSEWIRQLGDEGTLEIIRKDNRTRIFDLFPAIRAYSKYQRDYNQNKTQTTEEMTIAKDAADLRYKEARAGKMELELSELKGQMHRAEDVEIVVSDMVAKLRAAVLALPGRLAVDTAGARTPKESSAIIKAAVDELLNETAEYRYNPADYRKLVTEREKWISVKEAETAKEQETKKATTRKKTDKKTTEAKKTTSAKRQSTSKSSAKVSKPRKT